jgi:hypothetical protein
MPLELELCLGTVPTPEEVKEFIQAEAEPAGRSQPAS